MELTHDFIKTLPKTDLHIHLDGSLRPSTIAEIAQAKNIDLPTYDVDELGKLLTVEAKLTTYPNIWKSSI